MSTAKQNHIRTWIFRVLAPCAIAAAASGAQASLVISAAPTRNVTCSAGTCTATAPDAVLNAGKLAHLLHGGDTQVASGTADAIEIAAPFAWTQSARLTLSARTGITITQPVAVQGGGAVTLTTTVDKSPGAIAFISGGKLDFWNTSGSLIVNGTAYTLVGDVPSLIGAVTANTSGYFALATDYDAKADAAYRTSPIYVLYGTLNGLGHSISNLRIRSAESCAGFIANLVQGSAPTVANLTLSQIHVTQTVSGNGGGAYGVGGLAGCSQGTVSHVHVTGRVQGGDGAVAGGIVGWQAAGPSGTGPITDSSVNVAVSGGASAVLGGVVAFDYFGSILRCAATGRIEGSSAVMAGGLVGDLTGSLPVANNWSSARISGAARAGGLIGAAQSKTALTSNYAIGAVSAGAGVTGSDDGTGTYASTYWDMNTTHVTDPALGVGNIPNEPGITGLTDAQLKSGLPAGFDPAIWAQNAGINNGYPYLLANPPAQ